MRKQETVMEICVTLFLTVWIYIILGFIEDTAYAREEQEVNNHNQCLLEGYTVYLDGNAVENPDKLDIHNYTVMVNDEDKDIILSRK